MTNVILRGKPDAGNPHVRFDEGEVASAKPRRGSLLYKSLSKSFRLALLLPVPLMATGIAQGGDAIRLYESMTVSGGVSDAQRVDTGYTPTSNTIVRAKYALDYIDRNNALFCARRTTTSNASSPTYSFFCTVSKKARFDYYDQNTAGKVEMAAKTVYTFESKDGVATVSWGGDRVDKIGPGPRSFGKAAGRMFLFSSYNSSTSDKTTYDGWGNGFSGTFYYLEILEPDGEGNEQLVHRFVPCKEGETVKLYDTVLEQIVEKAGGGSFVIPPGTPLLNGTEVTATSLDEVGDGDYAVTVTLGRLPASVIVTASAEGAADVVFPAVEVEANGTAVIPLTGLAADTYYSVSLTASNEDGGDKTVFAGYAYTGLRHDGVWTSAASGNWTDDSNWKDGQVARGARSTATFAAEMTGDVAVTMDDDISIGHLAFSNLLGSATHRWSFAAPDGHVLKLDADGIGGGVSRLDIGPGAELSLKSVIGTNTLVKSGPGQLRMDGSASSYTGTLRVAEGSLYFGVKSCLSGLKRLVLGGGDLPVSVNAGNLGDFSNCTIELDAADTNDVSIYWDINNSIQYKGKVILRRRLAIDANYNMYFQNEVSGGGGLYKRGRGSVLFQYFQGAVGSVTVSEGNVGVRQYTAPLNYSKLVFGDERTGAGNVGFAIGDGDGGKLMTLLSGTSLHFTSNGTGSASIYTISGQASPVTIAAPIVIDRDVSVRNEYANYDAASGKYGLQLSGVVSGAGGLRLKGSASNRRVCVSAANTYSGGTVIVGFVKATSAGKFGTGSVTLDKGWLDTSSADAIDDGADLAFVDDVANDVFASVKLAEGVQETVHAVSVNGHLLSRGVWGSTESGAPNVDDIHFEGPGTVRALSGAPGLVLIVR